MKLIEKKLLEQYLFHTMNLFFKTSLEKLRMKFTLYGIGHEKRDLELLRGILMT